MADEITIQSGIAVSKGNLIVPNYNTTRYRLDMTGSGGPSPGFFTVGLTEESLTFPELAVLGFLHMLNLDATNFVRWGFSTGVYGGRINAGEPSGPFRLNPGATLYIIADTAPVDCLINCFEN